jgi:hypothetical protein
VLQDGYIVLHISGAADDTPFCDHTFSGIAQRSNGISFNDAKTPGAGSSYDYNINAVNFKRKHLYAKTAAERYDASRSQAEGTGDAFGKPSCKGTKG